MAMFCFWVFCFTIRFPHKCFCPAPLDNTLLRGFVSMYLVHWYQWFSYVAFVVVVEAVVCGWGCCGCGCRGNSFGRLLWYHLVSSVTIVVIVVGFLTGMMTNNDQLWLAVAHQPLSTKAGHRRRGVLYQPWSAVISTTLLWIHATLLSVLQCSKLVVVICDPLDLCYDHVTERGGLGWITTSQPKSRRAWTSHFMMRMTLMIIIVVDAGYTQWF